MVDRTNTDNEGAVDVQGFMLPVSNLVSTETRSVICDDIREASEGIPSSFPRIDDNTKLEDIPDIRNRQAEFVYASRFYANLKSRYKVSVQSESIAGVYTEVFTPTDGISETNRQRVLINLHGGSFTGGSRSGSRLESIPVAAIGKIKVLGIDYSLAPEHQFPAASQDVAAVYKALLKEYKPENIGIYGYSAGGLLTAEAMAWFQKEKLPLPAAIGMLCGAARFWMDGISGSIQAAITGMDANLLGVREAQYFKNIESTEDPLAFPGVSPDIMAKFPPSLLITSTHDCSLSSVVSTHSQLIKLGVEADLHVWEGVDHSFICNSNLPECREAFDVVVNFFDKHLSDN